jgi:hypothetical protein
MSVYSYRDDGAARRAGTSARLLLAALLPLLLLAGCGPGEAARGPGAALPSFLLVEEAIARPELATGAVAGYLMAEAGGELLAPGLSSGPDGLRPTGSERERIWIERPATAGTPGAMPAPGQRFVLAVVSGRLEGPGAYGPAGAYRFRIIEPRVTVVTPRETTVAGLLERPEAFAGRAVRVNGALLASPASALLVERLGPGGVPEADARQLKLARPLPLEALPESLQRSPSGDVRFGLVQVEGFWREGALTPLAILPVSAPTR